MCKKKNTNNLNAFHYNFNVCIYSICRNVLGAFLQVCKATRISLRLRCTTRSCFYFWFLACLAFIWLYWICTISVWPSNQLCCFEQPEPPACSLSRPRQCSGTLLSNKKAFIAGDSAIFSFWNQEIKEYNWTILWSLLIGSESAVSIAMLCIKPEETCYATTHLSKFKTQSMLRFLPSRR